jgi:hypothetical protein
MNDQEQQLDLMATVLLKLEQLGKAAEQGDEQAKTIMQEIQKRAQEKASKESQQPAMAKCGAKLHKKGERGLKLVKKAACGCKTRIKKVGGKLVEVDCNGNIVK